MKKVWSVLIFAGLLLAVCQTAWAVSAVAGKNVTYAVDGVSMKGYLAFDQSLSGKRPGVLIVHEWWGHNPYVRKRADMLAKMGYVAFALDMYGDGKQADHPQDAGKFASEIMKNFDTMESRFKAALDFLKKQEAVDSSKIAAIGYCFGGAVVLNMARQGLPLAGVASFHGSLGPARPAKPGGVKARILVMNGEADKMVTSEQIEAFKKEMKELGANYHFINYPGALHSFTNPQADEFAKKFNMPVGYNEAADKASWNELGRFLAEIFK